MSTTLRVFLIAGVFCYALLLLNYLVKKRLNIKYTLLWIFSVLVLFLMALFPQGIYWLSELLGFEAPINMVYIVAGAFGLLILLSITVIVSDMNRKIIKLVQKQALLEKRIRELEEREKEAQKPQAKHESRDET